MRGTLRSAAAVVMNTPEAAVRLLETFPDFRERRVLSITNAFDAKDFAGVVPRRRDDGVFRIVHSGSLHTELALEHRRTGRLRRLLGGMPVPTVDFLTRSHVFLMRAVDEVIRADPGVRGVIELHLVGAVTDADRQAAARYPFVHFHGLKSHAEAVSLLRTATCSSFPCRIFPPGCVPVSFQGRHTSTWRPERRSLLPFRMGTPATCFARSEPRRFVDRLTSIASSVRFENASRPGERVRPGHSPTRRSLRDSRHAT